MEDLCFGWLVVLVVANKPEVEVFYLEEHVGFVKYVLVPINKEIYDKCEVINRMG